MNSKPVDLKTEMRHVFRLKGSGAVTGQLAVPGRVMINWVVPGVGSQGRILLPVHVLSPKLSDLSLLLTGEPGKPLIFPAGECFEINLEITNFSREPKIPILHFDFEKMGELIIQGSSKRELTVLRPGEKIVFPLSLIASVRGVLPLEGISLENQVGACLGSILSI